MIIDFHNHIGKGGRTDEPVKHPQTEFNPDELLFKQYGKDIIAKMDTAGIERSVIFPFGRSKDGTFRNENDLIFETCDANPRLLAFCRLSPKNKGVGELKRCIKKGALGIKLHPRTQAFGLDDPRLYNILHIAEEERMPVLIHSEYIPSEDRLRGDVSFTTPIKFIPLARRFPKLNLIVGHLGRHEDRTREKLRNIPNVYFETSTSVHADILVAAAAYGPERILFGSDSPFSHPSVERMKIDILPLAKDEKELILGGNARRLLNQ